jgi:UDP-N-acetylmuramoylalanine--D-glutamate ligase
MLNTIHNYLAHKSILILGFGKEGQSSYRFLRNLFSTKAFAIADKNSTNESTLNIGKTDKIITLLLGDDYLRTIADYDLVLKSPGIYLEDKYSNISSQTNLFLQFFSKQTIGITGTKGKSTCSSLIHHILKKANRDSLLVGNIGQPPFDIIKEVTEETTIVYELSSHQLTDIKTSPSISILLNIFPEHLDHYPDFNTYADAKAKIFSHQDSEGIQIYNADQDLLKSYLNHKIPKRQSLSFSLQTKENCYLEEDQLLIQEKDQHVVLLHKNQIKNLIGDHNLYNIMAATLACTKKELSIEEISPGILSFKSLEHRLEYVGCYSGIHFYNDSIATIPEATIMALKAIPETDTLILGGYDRGLDYTNLYNFLKNSIVTNLFFTGPAGKRMLKEYSTICAKQNCILIKDLENSFVEIIRNTSMGKCCLLSPAAASYDQYKNFEERGRIYKKLASESESLASLK